ncbi:MAG: argininosuccinate lyase [Alphaproteobacteria bacterium]
MAKKKITKANTLWGGHFSAGPAAAFAAINPSIDVDQRLYREDIQGSLAHVAMLAAQKIISAKEAAAISRGLKQIQAEIESGKFTFTPALEDIHLHIEARLTDLIGAVAGKLHTARSRNDQVATDLRLYSRRAIVSLDAALRDLQAALIAQADSHTATILPGLTHLQPAQPIVFGHHLMAYVEMFQRDRTRLEDAAVRLNESPLGAAALAGTTYPIDRQMAAQALGFAAPMRNSLDAVSDRDYVIEILAALSLVAMHLSRMAEEMIFWSNPLVGFIRLSDAFTSGSSIIPQKRNPDAAELIRGKSGGIIGALSALLVTMKSLPLAYNKDMQEDKRAYFHALDETLLMLSAMTGMVADMRVNKIAMRRAASLGYLNATDLADWLVQRLNLPFRDAHHVSGKLVKLAETKAVGLEDLSLKEMQSVHPKITHDIYQALALDKVVARRESEGGTAPTRVRAAIQAAKKDYL